MDWILMIMFGLAGAVSTYRMIKLFKYFHDKENR
jgi:hypothetical protein